MKKDVLLIVLLVLSFASVNTFATDKSNVLGVSKIWALYQVISKVDGWYQIKMDTGKIYRIRDQSIIRTNETLNTEPVKEEYKEPVYEEPVKIWYQLTLSDKRIVNKFLYKMTKVINQRWEDYKDLLVSALYELIDEYSHLERLVAILQEVITRLTTTIIEENNPVNNDYNFVNTNTSTNTYNLKNIDISKVKNTWMKWYNDVRIDLWRWKLVYNSKLESTALDWSKVSKTRWYMDHKRSSWDAYYDYNKITTWFKDRGVVCKNIYGVTHTENIWYWYYTCNDSDCTDELINSIRSTFDFFYWEKYKDYQAHYLSIINKYFTQIWLWIEIDEQNNRYYLTVHYCTEVQ